MGQTIYQTTWISVMARSLAHLLSEWHLLRVMKDEELMEDNFSLLDPEEMSTRGPNERS
jgi:hypothetical protein